MKHCTKRMAKDFCCDMLLIFAGIAIGSAAFFLLSGCVIIWDTSGSPHIRQYTVTEPPKVVVREPDVTADIDLGIYRGEERF